LGFDDGNGTITPLNGAIPAGSGVVTPALGPAYDPADADKNMASGAITPQFSRPVRVFDSLGTGHDISVAFLKISSDKWAVEVFALNASEVTEANGLLASGTLTFNGDGSLQNVSSTLSTPVDVTWSNTLTAPEPSQITFNWGTAGGLGDGLTDGMSQFDTNYKVNFANQNGAQVGELTGVSIDENGFITVSYSNGETQKLFKIPLANFANPDALQSLTGNVYSQTSSSGEVNLSQAGSSGVGKIASSSLEASNVELADQLTDMIVAQRAYQANTKVIQTSDGLLDALNQIIR
jgi:flagellar hook protein FlgE